MENQPKSYASEYILANKLAFQLYVLLQNTPHLQALDGKRKAMQSESRQNFNLRKTHLH